MGKMDNSLGASTSQAQLRPRWQRFPCLRIGHIVGVGGSIRPEHSQRFHLNIRGPLIGGSAVVNLNKLA